MKVLFMLNAPPYGSEKSYNGLRLALALAKRDPANSITVFLMADAVACGKKGQRTPTAITTSNECSSACWPATARCCCPPVGHLN